MYRKDFPIFYKEPELTYLDSAATTQKPKSVIESITNFYSQEYGTVHRAVYDLAAHATKRYSDVREKVRSFLGAQCSDEIVFTRGTTAGINLLARSLCEMVLQKGDRILLTEVEHHSNLIPWQMAAKRHEAELCFIPVTDEGAIDGDAFMSFMDERVKIVSIPHVSNVLGTINPIQRIVREAHKIGALVIVDGAQSTSRMAINVCELDADFYLFSGHKIYGPTGVGVLYGKLALLEQMPPVEGGGDMIGEVTLHQSTYAHPPLKFEAGTPMIAQVIGLGSAIDYINHIGVKNLCLHEQELISYAQKRLTSIRGLKLIGSAFPKVGIQSFTIDKVHPLDIATLLNCKKIAIRSGHLCSQPTMHRFGITTALRISFGIYTSQEEIAHFCNKLEEILSII